MTNPCQDHGAESAWADYMKEAFESWFKSQIWGNEDFKACLSEAWQAALLAHIQRGAVPEGNERDEWEAAVFTLMGHAASLYFLGQSDMPNWFYELAEKLARRHVDEALADRVREVGVQQRAMLAAAPAPAPAEVPMPEPVGTRFDGTKLLKEADVRTYAAAREAAGYARGLAEAGRDAERYRLAKLHGWPEYRREIHPNPNGVPQWGYCGHWFDSPAACSTVSSTTGSRRCSMAERPMLMSAPMVRALLAGTKTQTRRVVKPPRNRSAFVLLDHGKGWWPYQSDDGESELCDDGMEHPYTCPYGQPGDRLWVREAFSGPHCMDATDECVAVRPSKWGEGSRIWYWADGNPTHGDWTRPRPSIHMPRWASRILLEVTAVRVERLQDISEADARAEGCIEEEKPGFPICSPRNWYRILWEQINGPGSWDANPWVWVVEFKRVTP